MRKCLNIPIHYLKEVKDDKQQFELFAVAVMFKMRYVHSVVGMVDNKMLREELHCKHKVAKRIIDGMADSRFFIVNKKNGKVFIPTFKSTEIKTFGTGKSKYEGTGDYCKKLKIKDYTLREMKRALRELLLEYMVHFVQMRQA